jgi:hypothetical protein
MRELNFDRKTGGIVSMARRASIIALLLGIFGGMASVAHAQAPPVIFFTDLSSGPNSGGDSQGGFSGAYVTLYGNYFGSTQGTSTVSLNGANCGRVVQWGGAWLWYQRIVVQLGPSCSTGSFVVSTAAGASNAIPFTVRGGNIYCVSSSGSDSNSGKFPSSCWSTPGHAISSMVAGDTAYVENGVSQTSATAFSAAVNIEGNPGGTAASPIALLAYPGATATIGALNTGLAYALRVPQIGVSPAYYVVAGMTLRGAEALEIANADHMWFIANDISCDGTQGFGCMHLDTSTNLFEYGNKLHDVAYNCASNSGNPTGSPCKFHGAYHTTNTNHVWFGWNLVDMNPAGNTNAGCYGIQFYSTGGTDQFDLHVHDNTIRNVICGGLNFSTVNPGSGTVEAYNNVIYHVGTGPDPSGNAAAYYCIGTQSSGAATGSVQIYNNSMYDCGSRGNVTNTNGGVNANILASLTNNVVKTTGSNESYITTNTSTLNCANFNGTHNDWFGAGSAPCTSTLASSLTVDPLYSSSVAGAVNLAVPSTSPLIGAGTGLSAAYDITGLKRPSPPSVGAYEVSSGGTSQSPNPPTNLTVTVQ